MATISQGYGGKPTYIKVCAGDDGHRMGYIWLEQKGIETIQRPIEKGQKIIPYETLAYATIEEVIALRDECNETIKQLAGL